MEYKHKEAISNNLAGFNIIDILSIPHYTFIICCDKYTHTHRLLGQPYFCLRKHCNTESWTLPRYYELRYYNIT